MEDSSPPQAFDIGWSDCNCRSDFSTVFGHHLRLELLRAWRRPRDRVGARINGGENTVFTTSARSQDRDFRMMRADACHDLRGSCTGCHIDDGRTGKNLAFGDFIILRDRGDDGDVHNRYGRFDGLRR